MSLAASSSEVANAKDTPVRYYLPKTGHGMALFERVEPIDANMWQCIAPQGVYFRTSKHFVHDNYDARRKCEHKQIVEAIDGPDDWLQVIAEALPTEQVAPNLADGPQQSACPAAGMPEMHRIGTPDCYSDEDEPNILIRAEEESYDPEPHPLVQAEPHPASGAVPCYSTLATQGTGKAKGKKGKDGKDHELSDDQHQECKSSMKGKNSKGKDEGKGKGKGKAKGKKGKDAAGSRRALGTPQLDAPPPNGAPQHPAPPAAAAPQHPAPPAAAAPQHPAPPAAAAHPHPAAPAAPPANEGWTTGQKVLGAGACFLLGAATVKYEKEVWLFIGKLSRKLTGKGDQDGSVKSDRSQTTSQYTDCASFSGIDEDRMSNYNESEASTMASERPDIKWTAGSGVIKTDTNSNKLKAISCASTTVSEASSKKSKESSGANKTENASNILKAISCASTTVSEMSGIKLTASSGVIKTETASNKLKASSGACTMVSEASSKKSNASNGSSDSSSSSSQLSSAGSCGASTILCETPSEKSQASGAGSSKGSDSFTRSSRKHSRVQQ